ncbi:MAG: NapC/NirT family cytochrome c [Nitrospirae bacterium]|nr:NapC/NirT family cytochrome c [Nitrospirota bacterium]
MDLKYKNVFYVILINLLFLVILLFSACGKTGFISKTEKSEYCGSCHVMQEEYVAWMHSGSHKQKVCVECHLPNDNRALHYFWKTIDGLKDLLIFHSGKIPERIKLSAHGIKVVQSNCIRCHENMVMMIYKNRKCWECHRRIMHIHTGIIGTI